MITGRMLLLAVVAVMAVSTAFFTYGYYERPAGVPEVAGPQADDLYNASNKLFKRGRRDKNSVCLTIDDGPHFESLPKILKVLNDYDVKATFFMVGRRIAENPAQVREVLIQGHEIGNHTQNHNRLDQLTPDQVRMELALCQSNFEQVTRGAKMTLFRAPGMRTNPVVLKIAAEFGYTTVSGNYGAKDFRTGTQLSTLANSEDIVEYVVDNVTPGGIILLHDSNETAAALPAILEGLKKRGLNVRTVSEMLSELPEPVYVQSNAGFFGKLAMNADRQP